MDNIYQSIEILSKEKGIDAQIVLDAVKDAMLIAARKHFRTTENYDAVFDPKAGGLKLYAVKTVAEVVVDPATEVSLDEARRVDPKAEIGTEIRTQKPTEAHSVRTTLPFGFLPFAALPKRIPRSPNWCSNASMTSALPTAEQDFPEQTNTW